MAAVLLVASVARRPAAPAGVLGELPRLEAEAEAAKTKDLYLVLDPAGRGLAVKARGRTLDTVPLEGVRIELHRPAGGARGERTVGLWTVVTEPEGEYRRVIAPAELKPYQDPEEAAEAAAEANVNGSPQAPQQPPEILPDPPSSYAVGLDEGWELLVVQRYAPDNAWSRFKQAVAEGWHRQWRHPVARPDRIVLLATAEQGSRMHHLFREGARIVLGREPFAAEAAAAPPPAEAAARRDKDAL